MRIVQVYPFHGVTGVDRYVSLLNRGLINEIVEIEIYNFIVCPSPEALIPKYPSQPKLYFEFVAQDMSVQIDYDTMRDLQRPELENRFEQFLKQVKPDLVNFHHLADIGASLVGLAKDLGLATVVTLHDYWSICPRSFLITNELELCPGPNLGSKCYRCFGGNCADSAGFMARFRFLQDTLNLKTDLIITVSGAIKERLKREGVDERKMVAIHPAIDIVSKRAATTSPDDPITFGFIGNLFVHKGAHILIEAFRKLSDTHARLLLYGAIDPLYKPTIERLVADHPEIELRGTYHPNDLSAMFAEIDVLVMPTICPEQPLVILEALQNGTPVIGSDLGGVPEFISEEYGALFEAGNIDQLAEIMQHISDHPERVREWQTRIPQRNHYQDFLQQILACYDQVVTLKKPVSHVNPQHLHLLSKQDRGFLRKPYVPAQVKKLISFLQRNELSRVAIFGSGELGQKVGRFLLERHFQVAYFLDNDSNRWGLSLFEEQIPIINPDKIKENADIQLIVVVSDWEFAISEQLSEFNLTVPYLGLYSL